MGTGALAMGLPSPGRGSSAASTSNAPCVRPAAEAETDDDSAAVDVVEGLPRAERRAAESPLLLPLALLPRSHPAVVGRDADAVSAAVASAARRWRCGR